MKCPYCGYTKTKNTGENFRSYSCPRCDYPFQASLGDVIVKKTLSIPFSTFIYTPIIFTIDYFIAKYSFQGAIVEFGLALSFHLVMSSLVLLFILFITTEQKSRIFLFKKQSDKSFFAKVNEFSPLLKIAILLILIALITPFAFQ